MKIGKKEVSVLLQEAQEVMDRPTMWNKPLNVVIQKCLKDLIELGILKRVTVKFLIASSHSKKTSEEFNKKYQDKYISEIKSMVKNRQLEVVKSNLPYLKRTVRPYNQDIRKLTKKTSKKNL